VGNLSVKHSVAMDLKVLDQGTRVLAAIVKYLDNCRIFEHVLESFWELPQLNEVKYKAVVADADLLTN
jgi:hypothetical protein